MNKAFIYDVIMIYTQRMGDPPLSMRNILGYWTHTEETAHNAEVTLD
jgi:hypothetical protein